MLHEIGTALGQNHLGPISMPLAPSAGPLAPAVEGEWNTSTGKAPTSFGDAVREAFGLNGPPGSRAGSQPLATAEGTRRAEHESYGAGPAAPEKHGSGVSESERPPEAGEVAGERNTAAAKRDLGEKIKAIDDAEKALLKFYDLEILGARGNQDKIRVIEQQKDAAVLDALRQREAAQAEYASKTGTTAPAQTGLDVMNVQEGALKRQIQLEEKQREAALSGLEAQRKILDRAAAADLASVERRQRSGEITTDAAAAAEARIVEAHRVAAAAILAKEQELAQDQITLQQQVANRRAELEQQTTDKLAAIKEKAAAEDKARAEKLDGELARSLANAIMGAAEGKESIGQALAKMFRKEETKLLEGGIKQLLDASGVGEAIDKTEQGPVG